jgi:dUTP pyrophosphatase
MSFDRIVEVEVYNDGDQPLPAYAHVGDAGADVYSKQTKKIYPGETAIIRTGLYMAIPFGYEIQVRPRSGLSCKTKMRVANSPGTIDHQYRGELMILMDNIGVDPYEVKTGDRIAQIMIKPVWNVKWISVNSKNELGTTARGEGGFGSTGE